MIAKYAYPDQYVMYLIVKQSLNLPTGKLAAQCSHAVGYMYEHYFKLKAYRSLEPIAQKEVDDFEAWQLDCHRKIVIAADDQQWQDLQKEFTCFLVKDMGLTIVEPGTETCFGLWPMKKNHNYSSIKQLKLHR